MGCVLCDGLLVCTVCSIRRVYGGQLLVLLFSACAVAVLGIYECRLEKQTSSLIKCILKRWVLYLPILGAYIRIFATLISRWFTEKCWQYRKHYFRVESIGLARALSIHFWSPTLGSVGVVLGFGILCAMPWHIEFRKAPHTGHFPWKRLDQ